MKISTFLPVFLFFTPILFGQTIVNWEHTNGPDGGGFNPSLFVNDDYVYAMGAHLMYRSSDGETWEQLPFQNGWPLITHQDKLFLQTSAPTYEGFLKKPQLWFSNDNGDTWVEKNLPASEDAASKMAYCSHGIYYIDSDSFVDSLFHSMDDGSTWNYVEMPVNNGIVTVNKFNDWFYLISTSGIFRTNNGGATWEQMFVNIPSNVGTFIIHDNHILRYGGDVMWHSHDFGETWASTPVSFDLFDPKFIYGNGKIYLLDSDGDLHVTNDFGFQFETLYEGNIDFSTNSAAHFNNRLLVAHTTKGIYYFNENTLTYEPNNDGLHEALVYHLHKNNEKLYAGSSTGVHEYDFASEAWTTFSSAPEPSVGYYGTSSNDEGVILAVDFYDDEYILSTDYGNSWTTMDIPPEISVLDYAQLIDDKIFLCCDLENYNYDVGLVSADYGQTWQNVAASVFRTDIVKFNGKYYATEDYNVQLLESEDGGLTWTPIHNFYESDYILKANHLVATDEYLFATARVQINNYFSNRLIKSADGLTWEDAHNGLPFNVGGFSDTYRYDFHIYEYENNYYLPSEDGGLFVSRDKGTTWLPVLPMDNSEMVLDDGWFYRGYYQGGVTRFPVPNAYGNLFAGKIFSDENNDGVFNNNEPPIFPAYVALKSPTLWHPYYSALNNQEGDYNLGTFNNPNDTIFPYVPSNYIESIDPPFYLSNDAGTDKDFAVHLTPDITDMTLHARVTGPIRPGFDSRIHLYYANLGTTASSGKVSMKLDPLVNFISATPAPAEVFSDSLVWNYDDFAIFEFDRIRVEINLPYDVPLETELHFKGRVLPENEDFQPENNCEELTEIVVGSYDPNDKKVVPAEGLTADEIEAGKELFYTIRFQNTGTFFAENVRITDHLDTAHNYQTLRLVAASHEVTAFELTPTGLLDIRFDEIFLPDSLNNEPESHGYVTFAIQRNKAFNPDAPVRNTAAIYFDFNEPIFTNEVSFTMPPDVVSTREKFNNSKHQSLNLYPNPNQGAFQIETSNLPKGKGELRIENITGQVVWSENIDITDEAIEVDLKATTAGIYVVKINFGERQMIGRIVVK